MKKILNVLVLLLIATPFLSFAKDGEGLERKLDRNATSTIRLEKVEDRIGKQEDQIKKIDNRLASTTATTTDKRREILENKKEKIGEKINKEEDRIVKIKEHLENREGKIVSALENVAKRIGDRIVLIESKGIILTDAKTSLAQANVKINEVKTAIENLKTSTATTTEIVSGQENVKTLVKEAYALLQETIKNIQKSIPEKVKASSTSTVTTTN